METPLVAQDWGTSSRPAQWDRAEAAILTVIEPGRRWGSLDAGELWEHRDLLMILIWRDLKVRYKQTVLGAAWALLQPFLTMVVFTIFFGRLAGIPSEGVPYPVFAYTGLLPWIFFSNAVSSGADSLVESSGLITKVYFPRVVIPGAAVLSGLVDFAIGAVLLLVMMGWYSIWPGAGCLMIPVLLALTLAAALGFAIRLAALNVRYRDVRYVIPLLMQLWLYLTPVIYPASLVPARWRWLLALNPMSGIVDGYRSALLGTAMTWSELGISAAAAIAFLAYAVLSFSRMEKEFADII